MWPGALSEAFRLKALSLGLLYAVTPGSSACHARLLAKARPLDMPVEFEEKDDLRQRQG